MAAGGKEKEGLKRLSLSSHGWRKKGLIISLGLGGVEGADAKELRNCITLILSPRAVRFSS